MTDYSHYMSGWNGEIIFGQVYHTPVSQLIFWACGITDGNHLDVSDYLQEVYTVEATFNSPDYRDAGGGNAINVVISGANNTLLFPYFTSGYTVNYVVFGHKTEGGAAFE